MDIELPVVIERQPDYTTCGPTSLHAVYPYFRESVAVADPLLDNPACGNKCYRTSVFRLIGSIFLSGSSPHAWH